jgi:excisionase family DNA binding protein
MTTHATEGNEDHPAFSRPGSPVSALALARRLRITECQAKNSLLHSGLSGKPLSVVLTFLGIGPSAPVCYTMKEVGAMLSLSLGQVRRHIQNGSLPGVRGVKPIRVSADALKEYLRSTQVSEVSTRKS